MDSFWTSGKQMEKGELVNLRTFHAKKSEEPQLSIAKADKDVQPVCIYATRIKLGNISDTDTAAGQIIAIRDTRLLSSGQNM